MMHRWISALLALCLLVGVMGVSVLATEPDAPTTVPTSAPTEAPTQAPTEAPTETPTQAPTEAPTETPTQAPTEAPTETPTQAPTEAPTEIPTEAPTEAPTEPPVPAYGSCGESMTWNFDEATGRLTLSGSGPMDDFSTQPWEAWKEQMRSIEVGPNVRSITKYAFSGCTGVRTIRFLGPVLGTIGNNAFKGITATVYYPGLDLDWTNMEKKNYGGELTWKPEAPSGVVGGVLGDNLVWTLEGGTLTIAGRGNMGGWQSGVESPPWYSRRNEVKKVVMKGNIYCIYTGAFKDMPNLTEVQWPKDLEYIYSSAFYNCTGLTELDIPYYVGTISDYAFYGCSNLTKVSLPGRLTELGRGAFMECSALTKISIPEGLKSIGQRAFANSGLKSITLPEGITQLPRETFRDCRSLTSVTLMGDVKSVGEACFENCRKLTAIQLPASLKSIGESAFAGSGVKEMVFGGEMPTFGTDALKGLTAAIFYPKNSTTWSETRFEALNKTYNNALSFYRGIPGDYEHPTEGTTEAPTELPSEVPTELPPEAETQLPPGPDEQNPDEILPAPQQPAATEGIPQDVPGATEQGAASEQKVGLLSYWPLAVAAVWFFGGGTLAVWLILIRPRRRR